MIKKLLSASLVGAFVLASSLAFAQDQQPAAAPAASPQMPATPSMDKSGGDMSKPAGGAASSKMGKSKTSSMKHHMSKHHMAAKHHMSKHHMMKHHMSKKSMMKK